MIVERVSITQSVGFTVYSFGKGDPKVLIVGGLHGDELVGIAAARILVDKLRDMNVYGTVRVIPIVNELGLYMRSRANPIDGKDLNRVFPGREDGSVSERIAARIWRYVVESDFVIDLHGCGELCVQHILALLDDEKSMRLADAVPIELIVGSTGLRGQLFVEAAHIGKHAILIESPGSRYFSWSLAEDLASKLLAFLANIGILKRRGTKVEHKVYRRYVVLSSSVEGFMKRCVEPGTEVAEGTTIAEVEGEKIVSPVTGLVLSVLESSFVRVGDPIARIATELLP